MKMLMPSRHTYVAIALFLGALFFLASDGKQKQEKPEGFDIVGAWELVRIEYPDGRIDTMDVSTYTRCKLYDADSMYYSIQLLTDDEQVAIIPHEMARYSLHNGEYVENGRPTAFQIIDDTTMTTVWAGYLEVMHKCTTMTDERKDEIRSIVRMAFSDEKKSTKLTNFVLSTSERELRAEKERAIFVAAFLLLVTLTLVGYFVQTLRRKRQLEKQLHELQSIRQMRPQPVALAMQEAESAFFSSEYYRALRHRIEAGNNLHQQDWDQLEQELKAVYPEFSTALYQLTGLSATEYHVCLLTKIRTTPSEIAAVVKKEPSSISSLRGRLYHKYFDRKGGAKEWDEFIMSL